MRSQMRAHMKSHLRCGPYMRPSLRSLITNETFIHPVLIERPDEVSMLCKGYRTAGRLVQPSAVRQRGDVCRWGGSLGRAGALRTQASKQAGRNAAFKCKLIR